MSLILEGHSRWDVTTGIRILRALEHVDLLWAEDVIQPDSVDDLRRLVDETSVPQAVSERLITRHRYREVLEKRAAHVVMLDVAWTGGVTESAQIADLADLFHLPFAPHDCTGPVTALVNLHLCTARSNAMITEIVRGFVDGYYLDVLDMRLPISQGRGSAPTGPGLGAHLRDDFRSRSDVSTRQSTAP
jgi:L-alanine-DL-glutamate epimerase-like enolase superfamily enzyme